MKVLWILLGFCLCLLSTRQIQASEASEPRYSIGSHYTFIEGSQDRRGHEWETTASGYLGKGVRIYGLYRRASRSFGGTETLYDDIGGLGISYAWTKAYLLSDFRFSIDPHFSPEWAAELEPHLVLSEWDLGFGIQTKHYPNVQALSLRPSLLIPIFSKIDLLPRLFWELRPENLVAGELAMILRPVEGLKIRTGYAFGKGDEGEGLIDEFHSASASIQWRLLRWLQLGINTELYRGDLRDENKWGVTAECYF